MPDGDRRNGHVVTEELNIQTFLGDEWYGGASIGFPTLSAYDDMYHRQNHQERKT